MSFNEVDNASDVFVAGSLWCGVIGFKFYLPDTLAVQASKKLLGYNRVCYVWNRY